MTNEDTTAKYQASPSWSVYTPPSLPSRYLGSDMTSALQLENSVWQAVVAKDGDRLAEMFSDDYIEVTVDGKRVMKDSIVESSPQVDDIESYEITNTSTLELGPDTTILSYHLVLKGKLRGEPIDPPNRWVVSVWRRTDNRWQCCFFQQTAVDSDV